MTRIVAAREFLPCTIEPSQSRHIIMTERTPVLTETAKYALIDSSHPLPVLHTGPAAQEVAR